VQLDSVMMNLRKKRGDAHDRDAPHSSVGER